MRGFAHAVGHRAQSGPADLHGQRMAGVRDQAHRGQVRLDVFDLPHHALAVDDRLARLHAIAGAAIDDHLVRKRIERDADQFRETVFVGLAFSAFEKRPQPLILLLECLQPLQFTLLGQQALRQPLVLGAQGAAGLELVKRRVQRQPRPLDEVVNGLDRVLREAAHPRHIVAAVVHGHQHDGQQPVQHQPCGLARGSEVLRAGA